MNTKCRCGGRLRRSDIIAVPNQIAGGWPPVYYQDTDNMVAHWKCDRCGAEKSQNKRQPEIFNRNARDSMNRLVLKNWPRPDQSTADWLKENKRSEIDRLRKELRDAWDKVHFNLRHNCPELYQSYVNHARYLENRIKELSNLSLF